MKKKYNVKSIWLCALLGVLALQLTQASMAYSQEATRVVSGRVLSESDEPLPGVSVLVKGTTSGTSTDSQGNFKINVPSGNQELVFSFIGYVTEEIAVGNESDLTVKLTPDIQTLGEIIVVGYGTQEKKDVTGAVAQVTAKDFEDRPVIQLGAGLQGKSAGVMVMQPSGKPQNGISIRIRGTSSINASSEPLYLIDGVPTDNIFTLNPNDIESMTVLKDASSAAIFGAAGANGVVLITTKRGLGQSKPQVTYSSYMGFSKVGNKMDVLNGNQYVDLMTELGFSADWSQYQANTNWQNEVFRTARLQNHQLSVSGSNAKTNYYISANLVDQDGVVRNNFANRYSGKINFDHNINNWLKTGSSVYYSKWHDRDITDNAGASRGGIIMGVITTPSIIGIYNEDGSFTGNPLQASYENPVAGTDAPEKDYYHTRFLGSYYLDATILKKFHLKSMYSIDNTNGEYNYFLDPVRTDWGRANQGLATQSTDRSQYWIIENTLRYNETIGNHQIEALVGFIASSRESQNLSISSRGFANETVKTVNGGSTITGISSSKYERANSSFLGRINYGYLDKYLLTANFRADASSVFGPGNQWGYFPSFSAGWRLSEESFMKESLFDELKLRVGWGRVGNDRIAEYAWFGSVATDANYTIGDVIRPGTRPTSLENKSLRWETTSQTDIGLDIAFFNSRISITIDAYLKNTNDLLLNKPIPTSSGFSSATQNIGKIENKGLEFQVSSVNTIGKLKWNTDFNISFNRNRVVDIDEQEIHTGDVFQRGNVSVAKEGEPLGTFWGYVAEGVDPETGDMKYKNLEDAALSEADKTVIGNANPKFFYGMTNSLSFANIGLSVFLQGTSGNDIFNASRLEGEAMNDYKNQLASTLNRWTTPGQITDVPRATFGEKHNSELSTRFIEDGSYLRIKAITLSYTLPKALLSKAKIADVKIYVTGQNLFTITKYTGYDPEVNAYGGNNLAQGVDYGTYPQNKTIIAGLNLSF
jgi:TonB-dependent starch-binding outer membrane protein SusC